MNVREPRPQDSELPSPDTQVFGDTADLYEWGNGIISRLDASDPAIFKRINRAIIDLSDINPGANPLFSTKMIVSHFVRSERAINGVATSKKVGDEIDAGMHQSAVLSTYGVLQSTFQNILDQHTDGVEPTSTSEALSILEDRTKASARALELSNELFEERNSEQDVQVYIDKIQECYFATLLSGKFPTYEKVSELAARTYRHLLKDSPELYSEFNYVTEHPEKLTGLAKKMGADAKKHLDSYNKAYALVELFTFTDPNKFTPAIAKQRQGMLTYAKDTALDDSLTQKLRDADEYSDEELATPPMQLKWELLPPGELENNAREIVESFRNRPNRKKPTIDLKRLTILENIRKWWGEDKCFYAKGVRTGRRIVKDSQGNEQPDEYIVLVLRHYDESGNINHEDAVAESPIADNALYIQRYDTNHWSWEELMKYPKADVVSMGGRSFQHTAPRGSDLYETMTEKVKAALSLSPEDFLGFEFNGRRKDGSIRIQLPRRVIDFALSEIESE